MFVCAGRDIDNCVGLKLAKKLCAALRRVQDRAPGPGCPTRRLYCLYFVLLQNNHIFIKLVSTFHSKHSYS